MSVPARQAKPSPDEDFDTGVYPADPWPELELSEIVDRARAALAGSPGIPNDVVLARFEQRWVTRTASDKPTRA